MIVPGTIWLPDISRLNDPGAGRSKYKVLAQAIRDDIASDTLSAGDKLPPVRDLAYRLSITPGTVARAYTLLTEEGRLTAGVGRGTFVADQSQRRERTPWVPPMHDPVPESLLDAPERAHLLSPKMPDVGQVGLIREAMQTLAAEMTDNALLQYPSRETDQAARSIFHATLDPDHTGKCTPDDIITAHGGQNAILLVLQTVLQGPSPVVAVDALGYGGFRSAALLNRADIAGVPWDANGPDVTHLENLAKSGGVKLFCTSAEVCNPTVASTTIERREEIARLAKHYGMHILDDDCYRLMRSRYLGPSYRVLAPEHGWYVTSPSKSLSAAMRIGFAIAPRGWSAPLTRTATFNSFGVSRLVTDLYVKLMQDPRINDMIDGVQNRIARDVRAAVNILGRYNLAWSEDVPFLWLQLPIGWRAGEFCQAADTLGVLIKSADDFALRDSRSTHAVRIAINGRVSHDYFAAAMRTLRDLLDNPPERLSV